MWPSRAEVADITAEKVLSLYQDSYSGLTARQFRQKLCSDHGIRLSYCWVSLALVGAGLITAGGSPAALVDAGGEEEELRPFFAMPSQMQTSSWSPPATRS